MNVFLLSLFSVAQAGWDGGLILTPIMGGSHYEVEDQQYVSARLGGVGGVYYRQEGMAGLHVEPEPFFNKTLDQTSVFVRLRWVLILGLVWVPLI